jgi:hypothetical protein
LPRHHLLHLRQKYLAPRALAAPQTLGITERQLHRTHPESSDALSPNGAELFRPSLNDRTRKRLKSLTPAEVFFNYERIALQN